MLPASCTLCKFYSPDLSNPQGLGICRRHPPTAFPAGPGQVMTIWPTVKQTDWCADGEPGVSHDSTAAGKNLLGKLN
jgi:hypothetical protein